MGKWQYGREGNLEVWNSEYGSGRLDANRHLGEHRTNRRHAFLPYLLPHNKMGKAYVRERQRTKGTDED